MTRPPDEGILPGDETSPAAIAVIAGSAAAGAVLTGASPTGQPVVDMIETVLAVALVVWFGSRAPWWAQVGGAAVAAGIALAPLPIVLGLCGFALAAWVSPLHGPLPARQVGGALSVGFTLNSLVRSDMPGPVWVGPVFGVGVGLFLIVAGVLRSERPRVPLLVGLVGVTAIVLFAVVSFIAVSGDVGDATSDAAASARRGLRLARDLETDAAASELRAAAESLREVETSSTAWWLTPARVIPVLAQHRAVGADLGRELAVQLDRAADSLATIDVGSISSAPGTIDVAAVRSLTEPVDELVDGLDGLTVVIDDIRSVWLVPELTDRIDTLAGEVDEVLPAARTAQDAVRLAPTMLGENEPRRYLLLFTTPAEARGLGGFIGNYGVVSIDDGRIDVTEIERRSTLEQASYDAGAAIAGPPGLLDTYGRFGLVGDDGAVGPRSWSNLTMEPHWPSAATAAIDLYGQSGDGPVDGAVVMDVYVLETLLGYTGPIERPGGGARLNSRNLADYLLLEQYTAADGQDERTEALGEIGSTVITTLLAEDLPSVSELVADLGPMVDEQRLLMWTSEPAEQAMLTEAGLGAGLPTPDGLTDHFSLGLNNSAASKIDIYLRRDIRFERTETDAGFVVDAIVTLTNESPSSGLPEYVIGNSIGLPDGTSRLYLVAYTTTVMRATTVDGETVSIERGSDAEHHTGAHYVTIPPGETVEVVYRFPAISSGDVVGRLQPLVDRG
ncbi:MAG: DUF4012 domain-containing protein [Ilumatobacter fluminis]|uniref:DUF4012 domain-containing protein n=1 Tax=Ilumatobacter fluminis TaxID=467091 RepID=UPI0032F02508